MRAEGHPPPETGSVQPPALSVVVCTRDRPGHLRRAVESILASDVADLELLVVDQSDHGETRALIEGYSASDDRVRYVRSEGRGLSVARNLGIALARGTCVAFTDDDCVVTSSWLGRLTEPLRRDPEVALVFGQVRPAARDRGKGFIVGFDPKRYRKLTGRAAKRRDRGIGANMALRRIVVQEVGGFDETLGAGAYFASCEDGDLAYRVLKAGHSIVHEPAAEVMHWGLRDWESGKALTRNTYLAIAAAYYKHVRCGDWFALYLIFQEVLAAVGHVLSRLARGRGPFGFGRLAYLFVGVVRSYTLRVDRRRLIYLPPSEPSR